MCRRDDYPPYDENDPDVTIKYSTLVRWHESIVLGSVIVDPQKYPEDAEKFLQTLDEMLELREKIEPSEVESRCPACGDFISYCQGHGEIGDPYGHQILEQHDDGNHSMCHPAGCDVAAEDQFEKKFERN